jgi:hypothetical protein
MLQHRSSHDGIERGAAERARGGSTSTVHGPETARMKHAAFNH